MRPAHTDIMEYILDLLSWVRSSRCFLAVLNDCNILISGYTLGLCIPLPTILAIFLAADVSCKLKRFILGCDTLVDPFAKLTLCFEVFAFLAMLHWPKQVIIRWNDASSFTPGTVGFPIGDSVCWII